MSPKVYFAAPALWERYRDTLNTAFARAGMSVDLVTDVADPGAIDYIIYAPSAPLQDFSPFRRTKAVLSLWAGVERIVGNASLTQPLCRMVDTALTESMTAWIVGHVLRHHLGMDRHIVNPAHDWTPVSPPATRDRPVAILGLGALGQAAARALIALQFPVRGWSRSPKQLPDIPSFSGTDGLRAALSGAEIVVLLLPKTEQTENILNAATLAMLPRGAVIVNPGRGALIDDDALLAALDQGQIGHATLDVFRIEPLPRDHPFWTHPQVTVTPHIAAETTASSASEVIAENIRRGEAGEPFLYLVDRARGY